MLDSKICGIPLSSLANKPEPGELAEIVAGWMDDKQAEFFLLLGEQLRHKCGLQVPMQWEFIAVALKKLEAELCDGSGSELIDELQQRLAPALSSEVTP